MATELLFLTILVFIVFWLGDLFITLQMTKKMGHDIELNPILRWILRFRRRYIFIFKGLEISAFTYLLYFMTNFDNSLPFYIVLPFILIYGLLVINNANIYQRVAHKQNLTYVIISVLTLIFLLSFMYLNFATFEDLTNAYAQINKLNTKIVEIDNDYVIDNPIDDDVGRLFRSYNSSDFYGGES